MQINDPIALKCKNISEDFDRLESQMRELMHDLDSENFNEVNRALNDMGLDMRFILGWIMRLSRKENNITKVE